MEFVKVEGLGNDFIVVDGPVDLDVPTITRWCDRRRGIGADGVLEMSPIDGSRIRMRYWNADGSEAEMCGNGLRCLVKLAIERGWVAGPDVVVETAAGPLRATLRADGLVRAMVGRPAVVGEPFSFGGMAVHRISVGNPHAVVFVDDVDSVAVDEIGPHLEHHELFPDRANVEFVTVLGPSQIAVRIWERGIGETMASGTGSTSAAFAAHTYRDVVAPVAVRLPGGRLTIELVEGDAWMVGPGEVVYRGDVAFGSGLA